MGQKREAKESQERGGGERGGGELEGGGCWFGGGSGGQRTSWQ